MIRSCFESNCGEDQHIEETVQKQLFEIRRFSQSEISVDVAMGQVVLRGNVSSWYRKQLAQETVFAITGLHSVQNLITVRTQ